MKCQFCGSEKIRIETPFVDRGTGKKQHTICCKAQAKNIDYANKHYNDRTGEKPDLEKVGKW